MDVYATVETLKARGVFRGQRANVVEYGKIVTIGDFKVLPFETEHDCDGSAGFIIYEIATKEYLLFATDNRTIKQRFSFPFSIVMIEASYCGKTLARKVKEGIINESLAKRLLTSHMEIEETARYIEEFVNKDCLHTIHLLHISGRNCDKERCRKRFQEQFLIDVEVV